MKHLIKKPLGLAAAITLAVGGLVAPMTASAAVSNTNAGDLAIVPYYTANSDFVSGVHITNRTAATQIVKFRMHRGSDSDDAIDFIIGLSPHDMFTGYIDLDSSGRVRFNTGDNSCTAPMNVSGALFPSDLSGANTTDAADNEGYITIIGMGQAQDELQNVAQQVLHNTAGFPADCAGFGLNFLAPTTTLNTTPYGVLTSATTASPTGNPALAATGATTSTYIDTPDDALRVSYFLRHRVSGLEFGNNAQHINAFAAAPMMANQQYKVTDAGVFEAGTGIVPAPSALAGYDFPNLNGGSTANGGTVGLFDSVIRADLGVTSLDNDWSVNPGLGVSTDWAVTFPGQNLMRAYGSMPVGGVTTDDIPVAANVNIWDREEGVPPARGIVVSPNTIPTSTTVLPREVNVINWFPQPTELASSLVLGSLSPINVTRTAGSTFNPVSGWARLDLASSAVVPTVFDHSVSPAAQTTATNLEVPAIGFTAWKRTFTDVSKNYGRITTHGRTQ